VSTVLATVGSSGNAATALFAGGGGSNQATYSVTLDPDADANAVRDRMVAAVDRVTDAGEITVSAVGSGFGSSTVDVIVTAPDEASLAGATKAVRSAVDDTPGTSNTSDNLAGAQPVVGVVVDRRKAVGAGTTEAAIQQQVSAQVNPATVATLTRGGNTSDVVLELRSPPAGLTGLRDLVMSTPTGTKKLSALANVDRLDVPTSVTRTDGDRSATVSTTPRGKDLGTLTTELTTRIDALALPGGAQATVGGVSADQQDSFRQLALALLAAIAIVYVLMVATFKSLIQPLILLVSVPFAATGALIGLLMLVGIVVTNAIVLIDLVNQRREAGAGIDDAVIDGARLRLRPILMTAVATIFALVPMSLGLTGGGAFVSRPLAIVVIGGLFSSTLLTLVLVPVLYRLVERLRTRRSRRRAAQRAASPEPAPDGGPDGVVEEDPSEGDRDEQGGRLRPLRGGIGPPELIRRARGMLAACSA